MQNIRWIGIGLSNALTKSIVHFYPAGANVSAPYPCNIKLSIFGAGIQKKSVALDGARLSQPDGVNLEAAFPQLQDGVPSFFGIMVELTSTQSRVDLSPSQCFIEICATGASIKYAPHIAREDSKTGPSVYKPSGIVGIKDAFHRSSLVAVNAGSETIKIDSTYACFLDGILPETTLEAKLGDDFFADVPSGNRTWGEEKLKSILIHTEVPDIFGMYMVYRDSVSERPVSIVPIEEVRV